MMSVTRTSRPKANSRRSSHLHALVWIRDKGKCAHCGHQCQESQWEFEVTERGGIRRVKTDDAFEAHHVFSMVEFGSCGLRGLVTLCRSCHLIESRKLKRRLSNNYRRRKMFQVLTALNEAEFLGLTARAVGHRVGLSKTPTANYLRILRKYGYVHQQTRGEPYTITIKGMAVLARQDKDAA